MTEFRWLSGVLPVFGGAVGGVLVSTFVLYRQAAAGDEAASARENGRDRSEVRAFPRLSPPKDSPLMVDSLPTSSPSTAVGAPSVAPMSAPEPETESPEEVHAKWVAAYAAKIASVQREGRDPEWATRTERTFAQDLSRLEPESGARVLKVDCRTTGCLATVQWDSYPAAAEGWRTLLHRPYTQNCAITLDLPAASEAPTGAQQATVVYQCEKARVEEIAGG